MFGEDTATGSAFVDKLWAIMHDKSAHRCITWSLSGDSIVIMDPEYLSAEIFPK
jgi:hypothetical protein